MTDPRLARWQLRKNGELLLRTRPPADAGQLRPVESSTWSDGWAEFYRQHPDLRPRLERSSTLPRADLADELAALLEPDREYVLVVWVREHADAIGVGAATVAGAGAAVRSYVVGLVEDGRGDMFVLDEPAGTAVFVDTDPEQDAGSVVLETYRWPDVED